MLWVWLMVSKYPSVSAESNAISAALKQEFLYAHVRLLRYQEEVQLVVAEHKHMLNSLSKDALTWDTRQGNAHQLAEDLVVRQGITAYAAHQAALRHQYTAKCHYLWGSTAISLGQTVPQSTVRPEKTRCDMRVADGIPLMTSADDNDPLLDDGDSNDADDNDDDADLRIVGDEEGLDSI
jgi:hypothetical protein